MLQVGRYVFKCADTDAEFEQIHRLNYQTFVTEIPQHADTGAGLLVDKFHNKNAYFVVLKDNRVVGMVSGHDQAPFSVAERLRCRTLPNANLAGTFVPGLRLSLSLMVEAAGIERAERKGGRDERRLVPSSVSQASSVRLVWVVGGPGPTRRWVRGADGGTGRG